MLEMGCLLSFDLTPHYAQVAIFDPAVAESYPEWSAGSEPIATGTYGIAVATQTDRQSDKSTLSTVRLEVWDSIPDRKASQIYSGSIVVTDHGLVAGNVTGNSLHEIKLSRGAHEIAVFVDPVDQPEYVCFVLGDRLSN